MMTKNYVPIAAAAISGRTAIARMAGRGGHAVPAAVLLVAKMNVKSASESRYGSNAGY